MWHASLSRKIFLVINAVFLGLVALTCLLPLVNLLAISFSSRSSVDANLVTFWPLHFTLGSYQYVLSNKQFYSSFGISVLRVAVGWAVDLILTVLIAYPLSKEKHTFHARGFYVWFFLITMCFNGGLIPTYLIVNQMHLINNFWALILPDAVTMFYVLLMLNFFRGIPNSIEEAALVDGANWFVTLFKIYLPLSLPSLATISLFIIVNQWNAWFDGMLYMNLPSLYPLMTWLQSVVLSVNLNNISTQQIMNNPSLLEVTGRSARSAMIMLCTVPVLISYPFLQKYFVTGIVMGSVKE